MNPNKSEFSLTDKLKALGVQKGAQGLPQPRRQMPEDYPIERVVAGRFQPTTHGPVFVVEQPYPKSYRHGRVGLWAEASLRHLAEWAEEQRLADCHPHQLAFLDTETSGLAGGTGTYAFLIGVARFDGDRFQLAQFFMRDPAEERAQLAALADFLRPCDVLVTFNGKAFDVPLLNSRYTLNSLQSPLPGLAQLDLLTLARRLWRDRLESRRLVELEKRILGMARTGEDVPGYLIPELYFTYLRNGDARPLKDVFYHNAMDVAAMAALLNQTGRMVAEPLGEAVEHALDLVAIGKVYETLGRFDLAAHLFHEGMGRNDLPEAHYWETQRRLSFLYKRCHNLAAAVELWQLAAGGRQLYAYVELAKYYEHRQRDYQTALAWTEAALELLDQPTTSRQERREWLADLRRRLARLRQKVGSCG